MMMLNLNVSSLPALSFLGLPTKNGFFLGLPRLEEPLLSDAEETLLWQPSALGNAYFRGLPLLRDSPPSEPTADSVVPALLAIGALATATINGVKIMK